MQNYLQNDRAALKKKVREFIKANRDVEPQRTIIKTQVSLVQEDGKPECIKAVVETMDNGDCIVTTGEYMDWLGTMMFYGTDNDREQLKQHVKNSKTVCVEL